MPLPMKLVKFKKFPTSVDNFCIFFDNYLRHLVVTSQRNGLMYSLELRIKYTVSAFMLLDS